MLRTKMKTCLCIQVNKISKNCIVLRFAFHTSMAYKKHYRHSKTTFCEPKRLKVSFGFSILWHNNFKTALNWNVLFRDLLTHLFFSNQRFSCPILMDIYVIYWLKLFAAIISNKTQKGFFFFSYSHISFNKSERRTKKRRRYISARVVWLAIGWKVWLWRKFFRRNLSSTYLPSIGSAFSSALWV